MNAHTIPSKEEIKACLTNRRNWGRWGADDNRGAVNLIDAQKVVEAAKLVRTGRHISLARPLPVKTSSDNERPALHYVYTIDRAPRGEALDFYGTDYHTTATTHIDALCHLWDDKGGWGGADPQKMITSRGATSGGIEAWKDGIFTRAVFLDVPKHRGEASVVPGKPVLNWELEEILEREGLKLGSGDAVIVYCGRESYTARVGGYLTEGTRPGLGASCLKFVRDHDISALAWDMHDASPNEYDDRAVTMHCALFTFGVALLDSCLLSPLARVCAEEARYEFLLVANPLNVIGGTGSPLNPVAVF